MNLLNWAFVANLNKNCEIRSGCLNAAYIHYFRVKPGKI